MPGLYPVGEGAGYAGGIVSAAVDGLRTARAIVAKYAISLTAILLGFFSHFSSALSGNLSRQLLHPAGVAAMKHFVLGIATAGALAGVVDIVSLGDDGRNRIAPPTPTPSRSSPATRTPGPR